ncbi:MAG: hypothetical protein ACRECQ_09490 [Burkholderiaceae bacterium]
MSILVRAALLGGLAYVVSRAVKNSRSTDSYDARRLSHFDEQDEDQMWPTSDQRSTSNM